MRGRKSSENTALYKIARHRDLAGNLLDVKTAAVEVINLLRPMVAISIFIQFIAIALVHYPEEKKKIRSGGDQYARMFVQEVRRFYPFFPFVAAVVKDDFTWKNYPFKKGTLTLLDIYGQNRSGLWGDPEQFRLNASPIERMPFHSFRKVAVITIQTIAVLANRLRSKYERKCFYLANLLEYEVPPKTSYSMVRIQHPRSGVVMKM